jgi:hypothetical protein
VSITSFLLFKIGCDHPVGSLHAPPGTAGELPGHLRRPPDDHRNLLERDSEHVVQGERQALGGFERFQHDDKGQAHGLGKKGFLLGIAGAHCASVRCVRLSPSPKQSRG